MAVGALPRARSRAPLVATTLSPAVLVLALVPPMLDLLGTVQPRVELAAPALGAAIVGLIALFVTWVRYPRTSWLAAAVLAAAASVALRLAGAEVAPALSLLAIMALGVGGAFASPGHVLEEAWLEKPQPRHESELIVKPS